MNKLGGTDIGKLVLALLVLVAAVAGYSYFGNAPSLVRTAGLVVGIVIAGAIASFTPPGRALREYVRESQFEIRKVVWPTREETIRTTILVIIVTIIIAVVLGLIDILLKWAILDHLLKLGS